MIRECDEHLGYLLDQIDGNEKLREKLHLIVTSDHGMEEINATKNPIYVDDFVDRTKVRLFGGTSVISIFVHSCKLIYITNANQFTVYLLVLF